MSAPARFLQPAPASAGKAMQSINIYKNSLRESQRNLDFFVLFLPFYVWVCEGDAATGVGVLIVEADSFSTSRTVLGQMKKHVGGNRVLIELYTQPSQGAIMWSAFLFQEC